MRKSIDDIIKDEIVKTIKYHVKWHLQKQPTFDELDKIINYYYADDVQNYIMQNGIYKLLASLNYEINN